MNVITADIHRDNIAERIQKILTPYSWYRVEIQFNEDLGPMNRARVVTMTEDSIIIAHDKMVSLIPKEKMIRISYLDQDEPKEIPESHRSRLTLHGYGLK